MARSVICISHELGAGGPDLARAVADQLDFRYVDEDVIVRAAREQGISLSELRDVERRSTFLGRLLGDQRRGQVTMYGSYGIHTDDMRPIATADALRSQIRNAIEEIAAEGRVLIVAHAASYALSGRDDVLRVLVVASDRVRARRVSDANGIDDKQARRTVAESDKARTEYLKRFYSIDHELPEHYDLVVNSDRVAPADLATVVASAAEL